jgi:4-hydroxybenzoate polyprenyltransferase
MTIVIALLRATHFAPSLLVTAVASVLAVAVGRGAAGTGAVAAAVLAGQFSVGWGNDWVDRHRDAAAARTDKPIAAGLVPAPLVLAAALGALAACVALSLLSGWRAAAVHLLAVGLGWVYDLGAKSTVFSVVPYAGAFGLLPVFVTLGLPGDPLPPAWAVAGAALIGAGAHFTNVLPDLETDAATGVRGLPHRLGHTRSLVTGAALMTGGATLALTGPGLGTPTVVGLTLVACLAGGILVVGRAGRERLGWLLTLGLAGVAMAALAASGAALV